MPNDKQLTAADTLFAAYVELEHGARQRFDAMYDGYQMYAQAIGATEKNVAEKPSRKKKQDESWPAEPKDGRAPGEAG